MKYNKILLMIIVIMLFSAAGCGNAQRCSLAVRGGKILTYQCENGEKILARYYSLADGSLNFIKLMMPDGKEYTLPQALSASGARYTNEIELVWWIKGNSAVVESRGENGTWILRNRNCNLISDTE